MTDIFVHGDKEKLMGVSWMEAYALYVQSGSLAANPFLFVAAVALPLAIVAPSSLKRGIKDTKERLLSPRSHLCLL